MKTYLFGLILVFAGLAQPAPAMTSDAAEQIRFFATCLGRVSATMEHEWLMGRSGDQAQGQRKLFESLVEAVLPDARRAGLTSAQVLNMRIEAKFAQARLLQTATFQTDERRKRYAARIAEREIGTCNSMLLG
ncbi:hypothetical protein [Primorskyibacter sp. 2E233]|uniref:hypothetical protein n=1 Tax=Primorskyibacter sp. 2E233 TaxID=3413431 RepID=UPI003BF160F8